MTTQKKEIEYSKETDDVLLLVVELLKDIKDKKAIAQIAAENIPNLMQAMDGAAGIADEFKSKKVILSTVGYRLGEIGGVFLD